MESFQHQALEVQMPDENFDPTKEPQSGEEFLTKVVFERNNCPATVVASSLPNENNILNKNEELSEILNPEEIIDTSPLCLRPTIHWKTAQLIDFDALRKKIVQLRLKFESYDPSKTNASDYDLPSTNDCDTWKVFCQNNQPLLSIILRIDQKTLETLLEFQANWLLLEYNDESINGIDLTKNELWLGSWIYSTLACLHVPMEPNTYNLLRNIAKGCIQLRNKLGPDDVEKVIPFNLFILIISKTFCQLDLFDYV